MKLQYLFMFITIVGISILFNTVTSFKTGTPNFGKLTLLDGFESNHFLITTCAIYRTAIKYLQHVYKLDHLEENIKAYNGSCSDLQVIIAKELKKMNINPTFFRLAREETVLANIMTDLIYDSAPYTHFDNEEFENGSKFIVIALRAIQSSLARHEWIYARMAIGFLFHSLQDFYSHSNWIELGMHEPNRDLATGRSLGSIAGKDVQTCKSCNGSDEECIRNNMIDSQHLTSGYFSYWYPIQKPPGKCNHGFTCYFPGENDKYCEGISKDGLRSAHAHLHHQAASVAYDATVKLLDELETSTSTDAIGSLFGLTNSFSVVFVIDVSEHLTSLVNMIRTVTSELVDLIQNLFIEPSNYILSSFNGSHWSHIHSAKKISDFVDLIKTLKEIDLQDSLNYYYDSLNEALKVCESNSLVFMFTDAPTHKPCPQGSIREFAKLKRTKIDVLFLNTSKSTNETIGELIHFSDTTGGLFMNIDIKQPQTIRQFIYNRIKEAFDYTCILFESMSNRRRGTFIIDSTATLLRINVISSSPPFIFHLTNPTGSTFRPISSSSSSTTGYLQMFTIDISNKSSIGRWMYNCSKDCAIEVNIKTEFRCRTQLYSPSSDSSFTIVITPPLSNQQGALAITTCDNPIEALNSSIEMISNNDEILSNYSATDVFVKNINISSESFRIRYQIGRHDGTVAYRQEQALIETSQILMIVHNQPLITVSDERLNVTYKIRNDANESLYFQLDVDGVLKSPKSYSIKSKSTIDDSIIIDGSQYTFNNESVRFIPLIFSLETFKNDKNTTPNEILFRHEQVVPLFVQRSDIHLEPPIHFINAN